MDVDAPAPSNADARHIDASGYAMIDDWGLGEDRLRRLSVLAHEALALTRKGNSGPETQPVGGKLDGSVKMWMRPENHPDLKAWLASPRLKAAVQAHLPNAYKRAGVVALRLGDGVKALPELRTRKTPQAKYISGYWHHDRCGRRLKAFLFLHDVQADGRPTMVANASHRTHFFTYDNLKYSRFADKYVRASYDAVPMTGKRGGGFVFDTNAIHRGEMAGARSRTVLLVEFMEEHKFKPLKHVGMGACAPARRPVTPTRADLCYEVVDREIVAKRC